MIITDVNVLGYAYHAEAAHHEGYRRWLEMVPNGDESFALTGVVLSGFVRVVTHPRIFLPPSPIDHALGFAEDLLVQPNCVIIRARPRQ